MKKVVSSYKSIICNIFCCLFVFSNFVQSQNLDSAVQNFKGYKVPTNVKSLGAKYWLRGTPIMKDLIIQAFQKPLSFSEIANQENCIQGGRGA